MTYDLDRRTLLRGGLFATGLFAAAPLLAACGDDEEPADDATAAAGAIGAGSLRFSWVKNVEFAGAYIADTNGYYKEEGFTSFELIGGGPTATPAETDVVTGKALIGISAPDTAAAAILKGAPIKIIGAEFQKNPFCILSMADNPIKTAADLKGKKIGVQATNEAIWAAFLKANNIDPSEVEKVPVQFDPMPLTTGTVDGWMSFITNEPNALRMKGFKVETMMFADNNYPLVSEVYVVKTETIEKRRATLKAFIRAQAKGWKENLKDPSLGAKLAVEKYGKDLGLDLEEQILESKDENTLILNDDTKKNGLFTITPELIEQNIATLKFAGLEITAEQLFDMSIVEEVYKEDPSLV
ncbi:ABC transporter substrate-binding protein [Actinocorallia sp. A-T 12471]|uniref:ABC transporter substrate-binding protein n=1 Tax=Actinocorallia sp. A-T 12471 TaxID=3089813 RepID=UPI0029D279D4|nr:ABC transporter substrate-binding protein [Actinocorallia sp. A-T 12471]MDX6742754.1 ABC transporter substrate-binding protein [Actinocorallia sp. A-T 12471]